MLRNLFFREQYWSRIGMFISIIFFITIQGYQCNKITVLTGAIGKKSSDVFDGQSATTRSLVEGLKKIKVPFNYNPKTKDQVGDVVYIVAGDSDVLEEVFDLKRSGKVHKIIAGPNLACLGSKGNTYIENDMIDLICMLSDWVEDNLIREFPKLNKARFCSWYPGVDEQFFLPPDDKKSKTNSVLIYNKQQPALTHAVSQLVKHMGWTPIILTYGDYGIPAYKDVLSKVDFSIYLSFSESLGIALLEAWSMNVPTLCWNPSQGFSYLGITYAGDISSCPLMNDAVGKAWKDLSELETLLKEIDTLKKNFSPRKWILENATDAICARRLIKDIESL